MWLQRYSPGATPGVNPVTMLPAPTTSPTICRLKLSTCSPSVDKTVRVWTANTGKCVQIFKGHTERVTNVSFSSDGNKIISMSTDGTTKIWDFPPLQKLINQTKEKLKNDPLTLDERRQYYLE